MKKISFFILIMLLVIHNSFASNEGFLSLGMSYQNIFNISGDYIQDVGGNIGMIGFGSNDYIFWNSSNIGLFCSANFLFPIYFTNSNNIKTYSSNYMGIIVGSGFRYILNNNITFITGVGIDFWGRTIKVEFKDDMSNNDYELNLGLGGQFGLKIDMTDIICVMILLNVDYTFINCMEQSLQWSDRSKIGITPFIGIGLNRYDSKHWGKP
jgi:hypothetical protein